MPPPGCGGAAVRDADLATALRHAADLIDDHALLDALLATINPYARGSASTNEELAIAMKAQVRIVNDWRRRHGIVGGVVVEGAAMGDADHYLEMAAFRSAEERLCDVRRRVEAALGEVTSHVLALEKGKRIRNRHEQERFVADRIGEIWGELARVRLLMRESGE
jgi:hypothetical protein